MFFFQNNILIPNVAEKNILILVEEFFFLSNSEFFSYNLMLILHINRRQCRLNYVNSGSVKYIDTVLR